MLTENTPVSGTVWPAAGRHRAATGRWMAAFRVIGFVFITASTLSGCGLFDYFNAEDPLPGKRIEVRSAPGANIATGKRAPLPQIRANAEWTQRNGAASHNSGNLAGPTSLTRIWAVDAGAGNSSDSEITSGPIVAAGRVFVLDAEARVSAFDAASGKRVWTSDLSPEGEDGDEGFGGGLAYDRGQIIATTGFSEILSLDASNGEIGWRRSFGAPFRAPPTVNQGVVVAVARDNQAYGVDFATGETRWRVQGATSDAGYLGGASPAIAGGLAIVPFGSGEVIGVDLIAGRQVWIAVLGGGRRGNARSSISDITGDPVVIGPVVVAANQSGRIVGIDGRNGRRIWTRDFGSLRPIWAAGESIFTVTDNAKLVRLETLTGRTVWQVPLPAYEDPEDRQDPIEYSGPVLVNGNLLITDTLGGLLVFEADTGSERTLVNLTDPSRTGPVVAAGVVYVLTDSGTLEAFR